MLANTPGNASVDSEVAPGSTKIKPPVLNIFSIGVKTSNNVSKLEYRKLK